jgi:F-type H+-transporting ATPase subunit epsilon
VNLKVLLPTEVLVDEPVTKVVAEAGNGSFCLLPRHVDFTAALVPGLLAFVPAASGEEAFLAVDEGILVKVGPQVLVSTRNAVRGTDLETLRQTVEDRFEQFDERERQTRASMAKLEADFVRRFLEMEKP